ncbi:MAG: hypothetical protein H6817_04140 [Phycisphaerales bacterium]|nr:hypothetical protein [Phycisphaerales bacterium]
MTSPRGQRSAVRRIFKLFTVTCFIVAVVPAVGAGGKHIAALLREGPGVSNHPVNVVPSSSIRIPDGWPLDERGAVTCLTCHETLPAQGDLRLRDFNAGTSDTVEFCAKCHADNGSRSATSMHWMAVGKAHILDNDGSGRSLGSLDAESRRCMACHDGVSAGEFANTTPWNRGEGAMGDHRRNHPVGVAYPHGMRSGSFRNAAQLPKQVRLPDGKVSCVSCHDLYSQEPDRLSVPIEESRLCMSCHEL